MAVLCQDKVTFAGFQLSSEGYINYRSDIQISHPSKLYRSTLFCGLVNQLASGTNTIAELMAPLRPLLSTKNDYLWSEHHAQAFFKKQMVTSPVLAFFDITKPTRLCTDASRQGLGFVLQQQSTAGK